MTRPVLVLHMTQGSTVDGAIAAMRKARSECHEVVDPRIRASQQLLPWATPARSLRHPAGTPETNNRGYRPGSKLGRCYQVEVVGFMEKLATYNDDWYRWLAQYLERRCGELGVPLVFPCEYVDNSREAYGATAFQRLNWGDWERVSGVIGHQHVPGNAHWDCPDLDRIKRFITVPPPVSTPQPPQENPMAVPQPTLEMLEMFVANDFNAAGNNDAKGERFWVMALATANDWTVPAREMRRQLGLK